MWEGVGLGDVGGKDGYVGWKCGLEVWYVWAEWYGM